MNKIKFGAALLCDQIYVDESTKKIILAGVYSGDVTVPEYPAQFDAALFLEIFAENDEAIDLDIQLYVGKRLRGGARMRLGGFDHNTPATAIVPHMTIVAESPSPLEIRISCDGGKPTRVLRRNLLRAGSTASPPPSAQSPTVARKKAKLPYPT